MFWQDGEDSEADAESTLALLNDVHSDGFVLVETDEIRDYAKGGGIQAKQAYVKSGYYFHLLLGPKLYSFSHIK